MTMSTTVPRLFALVIGINRYKELRPKLYGAVADANAIIEYLSSKTSASRILSLKDKQATRKAIIKAFKTLNESKDIEKNDPIMIYFAGHGGEAQIQGQEEMTQMILPYDASPRTQNVGELPVILGIPDFEIRKLLNDIALEKGNNIVRFFTDFFFQIVMIEIDSHIRLLPFWTWNTPRIGKPWYGTTS
jgi:hypothetical protein